MAGVDWGTLVETLLRIEELAPTESGLLSFGSAPIGGIFVERGRVCWVAACGLERRLCDLLRSYASIDPSELERVSERCRSQGVPLGQTLVAEGLLRPSELEGALRHHSAECLLDLCRSGYGTSWASHAGRGYAPRFTYRAAELLLDSVALVYPALQQAALGELTRFSGPARRCVAFVLDPAAEASSSLGSLDAPLPIAEAGNVDVREMLALGRAISAVPRASRELGTAPSFALSTTSDGSTVLSWWHEALLFAIDCQDRLNLAAVTAQHLERG